MIRSLLPVQPSSRRSSSGVDKTCPHEPISSGRTGSAEIKTGERRVIEYLLSPVMQAVKDAGRER
jgi:hypothetical protein